MPDDVVSRAERVRTRGDFAEFVYDLDGGWPGDVPSLLRAIAATIPEVVRADGSAANERVPWVVFARVIAGALSGKACMAVPEVDELPEPPSREDAIALCAALSDANSPERCAHAIELLAQSYSRAWENYWLSQYIETAGFAAGFVGDTEMVVVKGEKGTDYTLVDGPLVKDPDMPPWRILSEIFYVATIYE